RIRVARGVVDRVVLVRLDVAVQRDDHGERAGSLRQVHETINGQPVARVREQEAVELLVTLHHLMQRERAAAIAAGREKVDGEFAKGIGGEGCRVLSLNGRKGAWRS